MIHQYKLNGYNIVLDINSGSVHVVDELAYDIIGMYESSTIEDITSAMLEKHKDDPEINAHNAFATEPRTPLIKEVSSSTVYFLDSSTASLIETETGISSR